MNTPNKTDAMVRYCALRNSGRECIADSYGGVRFVWRSRCDEIDAPLSFDAYYAAIARAETK